MNPLFKFIVCLCAFGMLFQSCETSIGYFENYGWPTYGIVKPFWLAPFSDHPSRQTSGYSRQHDILSAGVVRGNPLNKGNVGLYNM